MGETLVVAGPVGIEAVSLDEGVESSLVYCQAKGLSAGSIGVYRATLQPMLAGIAETFGIQNVTEISTEHIQAFIAYRQEQGALIRGGPRAGTPRRPRVPLSATQLASYAGMARMFFTWLEQEGLVVENPAENLPRRKVTPPKIETLTAEELEALFDAAKGNDFVSVRNSTVLATLLGTGMRVSECLGLTVEQADLTSGVVRFVGKGGVDRMVAISRADGSPTASGPRAETPVGGRSARSGAWSRPRSMSRRLSGTCGNRIQTSRPAPLPCASGRSCSGRRNAASLMHVACRQVSPEAF